MIDTKLINYLNERAENMTKYSDKITDALRQFDTIITPIAAKINLDFRDTEVLGEKTTEYGKITYRLHIRKETAAHGAGIAVQIDDPMAPIYKYEWVYESNVALQKAAVKRLATFIKLYSEYATEKENEYREIAEMAEAMLAAVTKPAETNSE